MPRILIIDDEPLVRAVLRSILERNGYAVMDAQGGRAGLALWRHTQATSCSPTFSCLNKTALK